MRSREENYIALYECENGHHGNFFLRGTSIADVETASVREEMRCAQTACGAGVVFHQVLLLSDVDLSVLGKYSNLNEA